MGVAVLAACGGGGGGSAASPGAVVVATPLKLTSANYVAVAQESLSASTAVQSSSSLITGAEVANRDTALQFVQAQLPKLQGWLHNAPAVVTGVVTSQTEACSNGGSLSISANDRNNNQILDAGDSFTITAVNCSYGSDTLNGGMGVVVNSLTGDLTGHVYSANLSITLSSLSSTTSAGSDALTGNITLVADSTSIYSHSTTLASDSLSVSSRYGGVTSTQVMTASNSSVRVTPSGSGYSESSSASGTLSSSSFTSQSVVYSTPTVFVRTSAQLYPASGQMLVTGADGSKARITAQSSSQVLIELDADGNGVYETSTTKAWSELL